MPTDLHLLPPFSTHSDRELSGRVQIGLISYQRTRRAWAPRAQDVFGHRCEVTDSMGISIEGFFTVDK